MNKKIEFLEYKMQTKKTATVPSTAKCRRKDYVAYDKIYAIIKIRRSL